ncbi:MAG: hypothetical protein CMJ49_09505 [Planctomycetaceae bacterium]|nr:hypothetical protein [Planctomycetaceae bacterium]
MLLDGALPEKIWWQLVRRRHFQRYFGPPTKRVPILSWLIDRVDPVMMDGPDVAQPCEERQARHGDDDEAADGTRHA